MTELDALEIAHRDAGRVIKILEKGALPDKIAELVLKVTLHRIDEMRSEGASEGARTEKEHANSETWSEYLATYTWDAVMGALPKLPPEDVRALLIWLAGYPDVGPGFLEHILSALGETTGAPTIERIQERAMEILQRLQESDKQLFEVDVPTLTPTKRRIIRGLMMDAKWARDEDDILRARSLRVHARKLAIRFMRNKRKIDRYQAA